MTVRIITDSASDITQEEARQLNITVVPAHIRFGNDVYRDGLDIDVDEFYRKLTDGTVHPCTAAPAPGDFARAYQEAFKETDEIVSIHVSQKHSAIFDSALLGKDIAQQKGCHIEVIDSKGITMWQAQIAIAAAKAAQAGCGLQQILDKVRDIINRSYGLGFLDTMRYAVLGGRLSTTILKMESILNVKPVLTIRDGEVKPIGLVRTREKGLERLRKFIRSKPDIENIAIAYSTLPQDAQTLVRYVSSQFPDLIPRIGRLGPTMGSHAGPGAVLVTSIQQAKSR